jgi:hypothetical protein
MAQQRKSSLLPLDESFGDHDAINVAVGSGVAGQLPHPTRVDYQAAKQRAQSGGRPHITARQIRGDDLPKQH